MRSAASQQCESMTELLRPGQPLSATELMELTFDGVLFRLTTDCWVPAGSPIDAEVRLSALGPPPLHGLVYSHRSAHWAWWGTESAPPVAELTTRRRRRVRTGSPDFSIHERSVPAGDEVVVAGVAVTTGVRTLCDEMFRIASQHCAPEVLLGHARELLAHVPAADQHEFSAQFAGLAKRPHIERVRWILARLGLDAAGPRRRVLL